MLCIKLGQAGVPLSQGLLQRIGDLCNGPEGDVERDDRLAVAAQNALGSAISTIGPEAVLAALPLNLEEVRQSDLLDSEPLRLVGSAA